MMKGLMLAVSLSVVGCGPTLYRHYDFEYGKRKTTSVGSPMVTWVEAQEYAANHGQRFEQTLTYSGRAGSTIRITYREATSGPTDFSMIARPAFSQDLTYDIAQSDLITFKHTTIRVVNADTNGITFAVIESPSFKAKPGAEVKKGAPPVP